jgi:hypothetical protein
MESYLRQGRQRQRHQHTSATEQQARGLESRQAAAAAHSERVHLVYCLTAVQVPGVKGLGGAPAGAKARAAQAR